MQIKRVLFSLLLIMFSLIHIGCWDSIEIHELSIVVGVGIDRISGDEPILVTIQVVNASMAKTGASEGGGSNGKPYLVISSKGKSVFDAVQNFSKIWPRRLTFAHNKLIVFGKNLSEEGIFEVADYLQRERDLRRTNRILVTEKTAKEVLEAELEVERLPAEGLEKLLTELQLNAFIYPINMNEFLLRLTSASRTSFAPLFQLKDYETEIKKKLQEETGKAIESQGENKKQVVFEKTAVFKNDRFIGTLNLDQSRGLIWLINKIRGDTVVLPLGSKEGQKNVTLHVTEGKTTIIPRISSDEILMEIMCEGDAGFREAENIILTVNDIDTFKDIERKAELLLKERVEKTISIAQKDLKTDFIGFGNQIHNYNFQEWNSLKKDWDQRFPRVKYKVEFDISITKIGMTKDSFKANMRKD